MSGKLCIVGYHQGGPRAIPLAMRGMHAGMRLVNAGLLDAAPLVTGRYPLGDITEAFETAAAKPDGFVKAIVEPTA